MYEEASWNVTAHAQKPDFVFRRKGRVHLNQRGRQFSRLLAAEVCTSAVVMLDTPCCEVVWRVLATHSIRQFPLHFPSLRHRVPSHFNWCLKAAPISDIPAGGLYRLFSFAAGCPKVTTLNALVCNVEIQPYLTQSVWPCWNECVTSARKLVFRITL